MTPSFDVLAVGNAIVDVIAPAEDAFLEAQGVRRFLDVKMRGRSLACRLRGLHRRLLDVLSGFVTHRFLPVAACPRYRRVGANSPSL